MNKEMSITKKMLEKLRAPRDEQARKAAQDFVMEKIENDNFLTRSKILMEEAVNNKKKPLTEDTNDSDHENTFVIEKNTPQFGDIRTAQEDAIRKAVNDNVQFENDALKYYPEANDMTLDGKIPTLNLTFQFRFNDPSGKGCYVWADSLQLTDENIRSVGKIGDAFSNWRDSIVQDASLMEKLKTTAKRKENE